MNHTIECHNEINVEVYILLIELSMSLLLGIFTSYKLNHLKLIIDTCKCGCCFECEGVSLSE